jgi:Zierdtviridae exonuclease
MVHSALAAYYVPGWERGPHPVSTWDILWAENPLDGGQYDEEGTRLESYELGVSLLDEYVEHYGKEAHLRIVAPEMSFAIDVLDKKGNYLVTYVGTIDGVYYDSSNNRYYLFEHKTGKSTELVRIISGYGEQGLNYWWAANIWLHHMELMPPDQYIHGVTFNMLRKANIDERPKDENGYALNKDGSISKRQPKPRLSRQTFDLGYNMLDVAQRRLRMEAWEQEQVRQGKLPIYKNPTKDCSWDCQFFAACEIHELGGDYEAVFDMDFTTWDPYEGNLEAMDA